MKHTPLRAPVHFPGQGIIVLEVWQGALTFPHRLIVTRFGNLLVQFTSPARRLEKWMACASATGEHLPARPFKDYKGHP